MSAVVTEANTLTRQLWHIAGSGDLEELDRLVGQGVDVNAGDRTGVTALMRAAYHGQLAMVRALIGYGADPNAKDRSGLTALLMAEHGGHEEIVEALRRLVAKGKTEGARKSRLVASVTEGTDSECGGGTGGSTVNHAQHARATLEDQCVTEENVEVATDYEDWDSGEGSYTARTLHEPPEIWEMVHTIQPESYSPSIRSGRVFSTRTLVLAAAALIVCASAVFGFLALRGTMSATDDALQQQPSSNEQISVSKSVTKAPGKTVRAANELTKLKPESLTKRADPAAVASSASLPKKSLTTQRATATKVSGVVPKQNKTVRRPTKLETEQDGSVKSAKKEPAPASEPVKPATTQKPKMIPWP